jgi:hypothetical protein
MNDFTLRPGDAVITRAGVRVFRGARHWPYQNQDFGTLAQSGTSSVGKPTLMAIDRLMRSPTEARLETNKRLATVPPAAPNQALAGLDGSLLALQPVDSTTPKAR